MIIIEVLCRRKITQGLMGTVNSNRQALSGVFIDDSEYPECSAISCSCGDQYTFHKDLIPPINISITTAVRITRRNYNKGQAFVRASYVSLYPSQIQKLKEVADSERRAVTELIREAVERFLGRPAYERNTFNFSPSSTKGVTRIYPRIGKSDWHALNRVSIRTNRFRTELVREAVDAYIAIDETNER